MPNPAAKYTDEFRRETADCVISTIGYKVPAEAMAAFFERTEPKPEAMPMAA